MEEHHDIEVNYIEGDDVTQDVTQDGIQDSDLDKWIEFQIAKNPNITTEICKRLRVYTLHNSKKSSNS